MRCGKRCTSLRPADRDRDTAGPIPRLGVVGHIDDCETARGRDGHWRGCIVDPGGPGPRIWFQVIPDRKAAKYQLHLCTAVTGGRAVLIGTRRQRAGAEADD
jgi:hypothetical protein